MEALTGPVQVRSTASGLSLFCCLCGWTDQLPPASPSTGWARLAHGKARDHTSDHGFYEATGI